MNFNDFYNLELYEIDLSNLSLLREMDKEDLMNNTDPKRVERARKELRTRPPKVTVMDDGIERVEYNFKATNEQHIGYIAEEVYGVNKELASLNSETKEPAAINWFNIILYQNEVIKRLDKELIQLQNRVEILENNI